MTLSFSFTDSGYKRNIPKLLLHICVYVQALLVDMCKFMTPTVMLPKIFTVGGMGNDSIVGTCHKIYIHIHAYIYTYIYMCIYIWMVLIQRLSDCWLLLNKVTSDYFPWFAWIELFSFSGYLNHFKMGITPVLHFNMQRRGSQIQRNSSISPSNSYSHTSLAFISAGTLRFCVLGLGVLCGFAKRNSIDY